MTTTLIIGGARSGKSRFAQTLAKDLTPHPVYLATSRAWDADHQKRIRRHQADRGPEWTTVEEETHLARIDLPGRVIVVDCVTLWLTNLFVDCRTDPERALSVAKEELDGFLARDNTRLFVTNELGQGLHADNEVGRKFTDLQGLVNQYLAQRAACVVQMVAGIPVPIKGCPPSSTTGETSNVPSTPHR